MLKLMKKSVLLTLAVGSLSMSQTATAGENGLPALNAIGRYFGVGYSYQGYQTAAGPRNVVRQMHPASDYPSSRLLAPYHARSYAAPSQSLAFPHGTTVSPLVGEPTPAQPVPPPKPAGPPPTWLEPYLEDEQVPPSSDPKPEGVEIKSESPSPDSSPSDRDDILSFDTAGNLVPQSNSGTNGSPELNRYRQQTLRSAGRLQ